MIITISKQEIFNEVEKRSSLEGAIMPERFEGVWASKEEGQFLDSFWIEGYTAVIQLMKRYLRNETIAYDVNSYNKDEQLTIEATMPVRFSSYLEGSIVTDIKMLIACNILHGWLEIKAPETAAKYDDEAKGYSEDLRVKLLYREAPQAEFTSSANQDDENMKDEEEYIAEAVTDDVPLVQRWGRCSCEDECNPCRCRY
jgi:hypothetical protein